MVFNVEIIIEIDAYANTDKNGCNHLKAETAVA